MELARRAATDPEITGYVSSYYERLQSRLNDLFDERSECDKNQDFLKFAKQDHINAKMRAGVLPILDPITQMYDDLIQLSEDHVSRIKSEDNWVNLELDELLIGLKKYGLEWRE